MNIEFTSDELKIMQEIVLFQRLLDPKRKTILNHLVSKLSLQIARAEKEEAGEETDEDKLDAKYRKKIVK